MNNGNGSHTQRKPPDALLFHAILVVADHGAAQFMLGISYYNGTDVTRDYEESRRAAEQGHAKRLRKNKVASSMPT